MRVREVMTETPATCTPDDTVQHAADLMKEHNCGAIPVAEGDRPVGVITDRDIAVRAVAQGKGPGTSVREAMTSHVVTCSPDDDVSVAERLMAEKKLRRLVVDENGRCVGVVAQADLARRGEDERVGEMVEKISQP
ncbi:MAG: CBS domain-containing protein [Longimicrobiaceae bacterium]